MPFDQPERPTRLDAPPTERPMTLPHKLLAALGGAVFVATLLLALALILTRPMFG